MVFPIFNDEGTIHGFSGRHINHKGEGELEKRIYGTEDEKDLNLIPKVFEVERTIKEKPVEPIRIEAS